MAVPDEHLVIYLRRKKTDKASFQAALAEKSIKVHEEKAPKPKIEDPDSEE